MAFILRIDGVDFSDYIQTETDISETMRRIAGRSQGTAIDGTTIPDLLAIKWDPSFLLKPMSRDNLATLAQIMTREKVQLTYTSLATNSVRTGLYMPVSITAKYAMTHGGKMICDATPLSFQEC